MSKVDRPRWMRGAAVLAAATAVTMGAMANTVALAEEGTAQSDAQKAAARHAAHQGEMSLSFLPGEHAAGPIMDRIYFHAGESVVLPACTFTPFNDTDTYFYRWEIDGRLYAAGETVTLDSAKVAVATWKSGDEYKQVNAFSLDSEGRPGAIAPVTINSAASTKGCFAIGDEITVEAQVVPGYKFLGWHRARIENARFVDNGRPVRYDDEVLSDELTYTFELEKDTDVCAVYEFCGNKLVTISGEDGATFRVGDSSEALTSWRESLPVSTVLTLTAADPDRELQWRDENGNVLGTDATLEYLVGESAKIALVYV